MAEASVKKKNAAAGSAGAVANKKTTRKASLDESKKSAASSAKKNAPSSKAKNPTSANAKKANSARVKAKGDVAKKPAENKKTYEKVKIPELGHRGQKERRNYVYIILLVLLVFVLLLVSFHAGLTKGKSTIRAEESSLEGAVDWPFVFTVESGMSASDVATLLSPVLDRSEFISYMEKKGLSSSIRVGSYMLEGEASVPRVAEMLTQAPQARLRVYSGKTISDIDSTLEARNLASKGEFSKAADEICRGEGLLFTEGWFLSGDYEYVSAYDLAMSMHKALLDLLRREAEGIASSGLSLNELVIIASMINAETQDPEQMKEISAVIQNRLALGMPLGIDATTRYELSDWTNPIGGEVFDKLTPYNTRRKTGLPPSGISIPGEAALLATIYPASSSALYYLHGPDGVLYISKTYEEHLETYNKVY